MVCHLSQNFKGSYILIMCSTETKQLLQYVITVIHSFTVSHCPSQKHLYKINKLINEQISK
jgi:hypothetical protein